jgi:hypothetical protein
LLSWLVVPAIVKQIASSVWGWLTHASFWQLVSLGLAGLSLILLFQRNDARHDAMAWKKQYSAEHNGRVADRNAYQRAQAEAHAKNLADIQRTEQRQKEISDARVADLNSRLERITRELRDNPSAKGSAGRTPIPETGPAPCRAFDPTWLCLSPDDRLLAAQNEERHDQLIDWVIGQSNLNPNK